MGCFLSSRFESCASTTISEELRARNEQSTCNDMGKNLKEIQFFKDLENSNSSNKKDDFLSSKFCHTHVDLLNVHEVLPICETSPTLKPIFDSNQEDVKAPYFKIGVLIDLNKHSAELDQLYSPYEREDKVKYEEKTCEENFSPFQPQLTSTKRIPALKGCRSQTRNLMPAKLSVKWAPEVYDPPVTSLSHTVKGYHHKHHHSNKHHTYYHCSKPKKHYYSNMHNRGKSSRGNVNGKKHVHRNSRRSSSTNTRTLRLQTLGSNGPVLKNRAEPEPEITAGLDYSSC